MGRSDYWRSGDWNTECDACGQKYKASKLRKRWDGLMVCPKDMEERHPQDYVRGIRDDQSVPFSRPEPPDSFVPINYTQYPNEAISLNEFIAKTVTKEVNFPSFSTDSVLGASFLGKLAIGTSTPYVMTLDDLPLSETIRITTGKGISESLPLSETITFTVATQTVLGGAAIGRHALGA